MDVRIEWLRQPRSRRHLRDALRARGWALGPEGANAVLATHPRVADGGSARQHLHELGLLTCGFLRIDFLPSRGKG